MYAVLTLEPHHPTVLRAIEMILAGASLLPAPSEHCGPIQPSQLALLDESPAAGSVLVLVGLADDNTLSGHADWDSYRAALARTVALRAVDLAGFAQVHAVACPIHGTQTIRFALGAFATDLQRQRSDAQGWLFAVPGAASYQAQGWAPASPPPY
ncbi:hypothetical protein SAMN04487939_10893 [Lysobacter sp. yr284]|uniref:hypothetical protein n=1 Tax=Lysobacter sp. yr284 TaxID=1761791 RepID=UPI00089A9741|nr:hypothetical protein [Lysobacter sp. yr284]SDY90649.1 hypothetical protein SAMN04487939_10893 [Lysobacter sp. yr284]